MKAVEPAVREQASADETVAASAEAVTDSSEVPASATGDACEITDLDVNILTPINGRVVPLSEVPDPAFAEKQMGQGVAIVPSEGKVYAPFDGTVAHLIKKSKHAIILSDKHGVQVLIHVGINTVSLKGEGFTAHVETGSEVTKGQLLLEFDMAAIEAAGLPIITPVIIPDGQDMIHSIQELEADEDADHTKTSILKVSLLS